MNQELKQTSTPPSLRAMLQPFVDAGEHLIAMEGIINALTAEQLANVVDDDPAVATKALFVFEQALKNMGTMSSTITELRDKLIKAANPSGVTDNQGYRH